MLSVPPDLRERLRNHGQEHVLAWWERLDDTERHQLSEQIKAIDLEQLSRLAKQQAKADALAPREKIMPAPVHRVGGKVSEERRLGSQALDQGKVAVLVVAGGQGSRLGFDQPKGMFPIGPVSNHSLFQIHAEKVLALRRRHKKPVPFLVMTSHATDADTRAFFAEHRNFGLPGDEVHFFRQGTMPAVDLATGRLILEAPGRLFTSPNGHGGTLTGLADSGLLDQLRRQGIEQVFYFQVDNPLVKIADPVFMGHHLKAGAEVSSKAIAKLSPADKVGVFVTVDGRCTIIEYSDLPDDLARQTDADGRLRIWAGNPAIHIFSVDFLSRVTQGHARIPFHVARKKVPYLDEAGNLVHPDKENALKFEMFIFDVLPKAERWTVVETTRREEFEPLKNATGPDSPESVKRAMCTLAADWLQQAGVAVLRNADGSPTTALEVSPLFALDAEEFGRKAESGTRITGPTYWGDKETRRQGGSRCSTP
jgi:UDP-N-acetylglucosamine/UDP-N-acetylgalactosamine diphosphorylase